MNNKLTLTNTDIRFAYMDRSVWTYATLDTLLPVYVEGVMIGYNPNIVNAYHAAIAEKRIPKIIIEDKEYSIIGMRVSKDLIDDPFIDLWLGHPVMEQKLKIFKLK